MNPEATTPPTAPTRKKKARKKAKKKAIKKTTVAPRTHETSRGMLVPPMKGPGVTKSHWFWLGAFPSCPRGFVTIGGQTFCKFHETVYDRRDGGRSERQPHLGQCLALTEAQVDLIRLHMRHGVIRFLETPRDEDYEGTGLEAIRNGKPRKGHPIRIPRQDEIDARQKNDLSLNLYEEREWDEPLAWHVYGVPCEDQEHPRCGDMFPEPLSETDISWPREAVLQE